MNTYSQFIHATSNPTHGAVSLVNDGSDFSIKLNPYLTIPKKATDVRVSLCSAQIRNVHRNILPPDGGSYTLNVTNPAENTGTTFTVEFLAGTYTVSDFNTTITNSLTTQGCTNLPWMEFKENHITSRVDLIINKINTTVVMPAGIHTVLGFEPGTYTSPAGAASVPFTSKGSNIPRFISVSTYHIATDLIDSGYQANNGYSRYLCSFNNSVPRNVTTFYEPMHPIRLTARRLANKSMSDANFFLYDQHGELVDLNGSEWSVFVCITWNMGTGLKTDFVL
jgi:hypothetical protein